MEHEKQLLEQKSSLLRQQLKVWEKTFSFDNGGRRAGREDIKANQDIGTRKRSSALQRLTRLAATKYKEYNKLRDVLSGKAEVPQPSTTRTKRRAPAEPKASPPKRCKTPEATPSKQQKHIQMASQAEELESATPVVKRTMFGPTPQKDGQFMGIFDLLPGETPSRLRTTLESADVNVARTPSKTLGYHEYDLEERPRGSRTPLSTGKRFLFDSFVTPSKRKGNDVATPSSSTKEFATPSFLTRDLFALSTVNGEPQSPEIARPWKRRIFGRSLSNMVKDIREKEKDKEAEEWNLVREMEETAYKEFMGKEKDPTPSSKNLVEADQVRLDVDGFVPVNVESGIDVKAAETKSSKAYKKKGLKRQTRRVNMRPVMLMPQRAKTPEPDLESGDEEVVEIAGPIEEPNEEQDKEAAEDIVQETQFAAQPPDSGYMSGEEGYKSEYGDTGYEQLPQEADTIQARVENKTRASKGVTKKETKSKANMKQLKDDSASKAGRKIDPSSQKHANFQRLKMRGKGPVSGRVGGRGRFGKKR